jgi:transcriptional regulator with XRE-family HTH domain
MASHAVDIHVGARLRQRRTLLGMSQTKLGDSVALTFQQIQKYERGSNRMGSSRLFEFARVLDVPVSYFFDEMPASAQSAKPAAGRGRKGFGEAGPAFVPEREKDPLIKRETLELVRAYYKIRAPGVRGGVAKMIKALAAAEATPPAKAKRKASGARR